MISVESDCKMTESSSWTNYKTSSVFIFLKPLKYLQYYCFKKMDFDDPYFDQVGGTKMCLWIVKNFLWILSPQKSQGSINQVGTRLIVLGINEQIQLGTTLFFSPITNSIPIRTNWNYFFYLRDKKACSLKKSR